jgi:hypothetical protein
MSSDKKYVMTYMSPISQETSTIMRLLEQTNKEFRATNKMMKNKIKLYERNQRFNKDVQLLKLKQDKSIPKKPSDIMIVSPPANIKEDVITKHSPIHKPTNFLSRHPSISTAPPSREPTPPTPNPLSRQSSITSAQPSRGQTPDTTGQLSRTPSKRQQNNKNNSNSNKKQKQFNEMLTRGGVRTPPSSPQSSPATPATPLSAAPTAQTVRSELKASIVIKVWNYFDGRHDFKPYNGFEFFPLKEDVFKGEINDASDTNKEFLWDYFSTKSKSENYQISRLLEKTKMDDKDIHLVENVIYVRIYPNKDDANRFLMMKKNPIISPDPKTTLKSFVFSDPNNTRDNKFLIDIKLTTGGMTSSAFDNFIQEFFGKNNFAYPLEKLWDPAPSTEEHMEPVCRTEYEENTRKRLKKTFNTKLNPDENNKKAFRDLTQEYFNLSYACNDNAYDGFLFYIIKRNFRDKVRGRTDFVNEIKTEYNLLIEHIKKTFEFDILFDDNHLACRM